MAHMDLFMNEPQTIVALRKIKLKSPNFRVYCCGWLETGGPPETWEVMEVTGAEFREAKSGPRKGELCIMVPGTKRTAFVTVAEIARQQKKAKRNG